MNELKYSGRHLFNFETGLPVMKGRVTKGR